MLHLCYGGGLRVSELIGLRLDDLQLQPQPSVLVHGKGRRERSLPLWKTTAAALRAWLAIRGPIAAPEVFVNAHGEPMSRWGFAYVLHGTRKWPARNALRCRPRNFHRMY